MTRAPDQEKMSLNVDIEDRTTWPDSFLDDARRNKEAILAYRYEEARIDQVCRQDILARANPPGNDHEADYRALVQRLDEALAPHRIIAYHCTRLTSDEIGNVRRNGLEVLSPELVRRRLEQCHASGHLTAQHFEYLTSNEVIAASLTNRNGNRTGMIWFCPNRSTLTDRLSVYRLLRSWGGEAVYLGHEEDLGLAPVLATMGSPCIVKCALSFTETGHFHPSFAERFLSELLSDEIDRQQPSARFDLYSESNVPASGVLEIIEHSDPRFELLTSSSSWGDQFSLTGEPGVLKA